MNYTSNIITDRGINAWMQVRCECGYEGRKVGPANKQGAKVELFAHRQSHNAPLPESVTGVNELLADLASQPKADPNRIVYGER